LLLYLLCTLHLNAIRFSLKYKKLRTIAANCGTKIPDARRMAGCCIAVRILKLKVHLILLRVYYPITSARHRVFAFTSIKSHSQKSKRQKSPFVMIFLFLLWSFHTDFLIYSLFCKKILFNILINALSFFVRIHFLFWLVFETA